jgi:hypothetical protein
MARTKTQKLVTYIPDLLRNLFRLLPVLFHIHTIIQAYFFNCLSADGNYHNTAFSYHMSASNIYHFQCQTMSDLKRFIKRLTVDYVSVRPRTKWCKVPSMPPECRQCTVRHYEVVATSQAISLKKNYAILQKFWLLEHCFINSVSLKYRTG